jgi:anti-sigma regulatory factor (Ser/Thr protein kinase)
MESILVEPISQAVFPVSEASHVAAARRGGADVARKLQFDEMLTGRVSLVVTEAATNILKHADRGSILIRDISTRDSAAIEIVAIDSGPGIANLQASLRDGVSTAQTQGTGLGAMRRLSESFDAYTLPGKGAAFCMTIRREVQPAAYRGAFVLGAVCLPIASETVCGDAWHMQAATGAASIMVADGLGHGPDARIASQAAVDVLKRDGVVSPVRAMELAHAALRNTRGAAVAAMQIDVSRRTMSFAGVGNIAASIQTVDGRRQMMSHNGIVGNNIRKIQEFSFPWERETLLIVHSDGLGSHWDLRDYPGLEYRHPALIAAVLYRDHARERDDVTVIAIKNSLSA